MKMEDDIQKTWIYCETFLHHNDSGHDLWHIKRVVNMAKNLAKPFSLSFSSLCIIEISAILHDVYDYKFVDISEEEGHKRIFSFLQTLSLSTEEKQHILSIIKNISFSKNNPENIISIEFQIVQDADRLDAIGAIGIARVFAYSGYKKRAFYNPLDQQEPTAIKHFYDKLLLLKDQMHTQKANDIAKKRHRFLELFLEEWYAEMNHDLSFL